MSVVPPLWQSDLAKRAMGAAAAPNGNMATVRLQSSEQAAEAFRHVKQVVTDARRDFDLHDLLLATRREETYQPYPQGVR